MVGDRPAMEATNDAGFGQVRQIPADRLVGDAEEVGELRGTDR
jgi:hypothetical protein